MQTFVTMQTAPTNPYLAGLITEPNNPNPVRWSATEPLKVFFDDTGVRAWSEPEKAAALSAFAEWSKVANIDFVQTTTRSEANILQVLNDSTEVLGATTAPADGVNPPTIAYSVADSAFTYLSPGGETFSTMVHEIGHVIGLYHPHSGTPFPGVPVGDDQNTGTNQLNQHIWTTMSYAVGWTGEPRTTLEYGTNKGTMTFDIAAAQYLYGARAAETGDNTYVLPTANQVGVGWDAIWDTGGTDTISGANATTALTINLNAAPLTGANAGGFVSWISGIKGGFTIANSVIVENAIGGAGDDTITGNTAANFITGGGGNDIIDAGDGVDTVSYSGNRADYTFVQGNDGSYTVTDNVAGRDGVDTVRNAEALRFMDQTVNLNTPVAFEALTAANIAQVGGLSAAYQLLLGGVPTIDGYTFLINNNNANNFGAGASGPTFNDENIYINVMNALYQGNQTAKANFDAIATGTNLGEKLSSVYNVIIPDSAQTDDGRAYFVSQSTFYSQRAAELGIPGDAGAALVGAAALTKIAVTNDIGGLGDSLNDLYNAIQAKSAQIPQNGNNLTPIETADGTQFDNDDIAVAMARLRDVIEIEEADASLNFYDGDVVGLPVIGIASSASFDALESV